MSEQKIDVKIADRLYPLTVELSEKEKALATANLLEQEVKALDNAYQGTKDKRDILAMLAFKYKAQIVELEKNGKATVSSSLENNKTLKEVEFLLDGFLKTT